jgi:Zinc dependent phospholipase C
LPKELTHWILAERVLSRLQPQERLHGILIRNRNEYLAGAVLPDTLLHLFRSKFAKQALDAADVFHDTSGNSYQPLINAEKALNNSIPEPIMASMLGVISHMLADTVFHPYVYAMTGKDDIGRHYKLETAIDLFFCLEDRVWCGKRLSEIVDKEVSETLVTVSDLIFNANGGLPRETIAFALKLHIRYQGMYDSLFWKLIVRALGAVFGRPFSQQQHLFYPFRVRKSEVRTFFNAVPEWKHPVSGKVSNLTLEQLADECVQETAALFSRISQQGSFAATLTDPPGRNLLTGMYGTTSSSMFLR